MTSTFRDFRTTSGYSTAQAKSNFINTSGKVKVWIAGRDYSDYLISGSLNEDSVLTNRIIGCSGTIVLGGGLKNPVIREHPIDPGTLVSVKVQTAPNRISTHPKGKLFVISSSLDTEGQTVTLEVGDKLHVLKTFRESFPNYIEELVDKTFTKFKSMYGATGAIDAIFDIEKPYTISDLESLLELIGASIHAWKDGSIQYINMTNRGGTMSSRFSGGTGLTFVDTENCISVSSITETASLSLPSSYKLELNLSVPKEEEEDPEDEEQEDPDPLQPEPETIYVKTKYKYLLPLKDCLKTYFGKVTVINEEKIYRCGKILSPEYITARQNLFNYINNPSTEICDKPLTVEEMYENVEEKYDFKVEGKLEIKDLYFSDKIVKHQELKHEGPGKQLSYEKTYEEMSLWRFADGAISAWLDNASKEYDLIIDEANSKCQEINEYCQIRDDNNIDLKSAADRACITSEQALLMDKTFLFYDCLATQRGREVDDLVVIAEEVRNAAVRFINFFHNKRRETNIRERQITFGEGGEVLKRREKDIIHAGASKFTLELIKLAGRVFEEERQEGTVIDNRKKRKWGRYDFSPPPAVISGWPDPDVSFSVGDFTVNGWPRYFDRSVTTQTFEYDADQITEKTFKEDNENPENNTVTIKTSTDNSTAAVAEPRNKKILSKEDDLDGDGILDENDDDIDGDGENNDVDPDPRDPNVNSKNYLEKCNVPTETVEKEYAVFTNADSAYKFGELGTMQDIIETISMPLSFKPLLPEEMSMSEVAKYIYGDENVILNPSTWTCETLLETFIDTAKKKMTLYENIIRKYLTTVAAFLRADVNGYRITTPLKGAIFDYYPFARVNLSIKTAGKTVIGRATAASFVFDQTNALVSIDIGAQVDSSSSSLTVAGLNFPPSTAPTYDSNILSAASKANPALYFPSQSSGSTSVNRGVLSFSTKSNTVDLSASSLGTPDVSVTQTGNDNFPTNAWQKVIDSVALKKNQLQTSSSIKVLEWTQSVGLADYMTQGEVHEIILTYSYPQQYLSDSKPITLSFVGKNSKPEVLSQSSTDSDSISFSVSGSSLSGSAPFTTYEKDENDYNVISVAYIEATGTGASSPSLPASSALEGMLSVATTTQNYPSNFDASGNVVDQSTRVQSNTWTFDSGSETFSFLSAGDDLTLKYEIRVKDTVDGTNFKSTSTMEVLVLIQN